jgi:hypothetical protein
MGWFTNCPVERMATDGTTIYLLSAGLGKVKEAIMGSGGL